MNDYIVHGTPFGKLALEANLEHLIKINFNQNILTELMFIHKKNLVLEKTVEHLDEYFFNNRKLFTINYLLETTCFFKKVLE